MSIISQILGYIGQVAINWISALGYFGVFVLMAMESMAIPIPAELVMPFAGFLAATGRFSMWLVFVSSTLGTLTGSLISYLIGKYGGNAFIAKFGKYVLLDLHDLKKTEKWFKKKGEKTIFIARLIPVVRHLISIPAGIGKMELKKFCVYTALGGAIWNMFLAFLGYVLGKNWNKIRHYTEPISYIVAVILVIGVIYFIYYHIKTKKKEKTFVDLMLKKQL